MILVVGATGTLGGLVVERLVADGQPVRALVRGPGAAAALSRPGVVTPVLGDLTDPASLSAAVADVDAVVTTANSVQRGGADTIESVDRAGNRALIEAARRGGVRRFVFVSALGASTDSPIPLLRAKAETEAHLRASGLAYTIVAPNVFMDVWAPAVVGRPARAGEPVVLVGGGHRRHSFVAVRDVAAFTATAVAHPAANNAMLPVGGPEAISWRDVVAAYEHALGRRLGLEFVAPGAPVPRLPEPMWALLAALETYDSPVDMTARAAAFGIELTSIRAFVRAELSGGPRTVGGLAPA